MPLSKPKETVSKDAAAKAQEAAPSEPREEAAQPPVAGTHIHTLLPSSFKLQVICKLINSATLADFSSFWLLAEAFYFIIINAPTFVCWKSILTSGFEIEHFSHHFFHKYHKFIANIYLIDRAHLPLHNGDSLFHSLYSLLSCSATLQTIEGKTLFSCRRTKQSIVQSGYGHKTKSHLLCCI